MIAFLKGKIIFKSESSAILQCQDIGYDLFIPKNRLSSITTNTDYEFFIYHHITDSGQLLFGFDSPEERELFLLLISVSGVGPKTALQFFDSYDNQEIIEIITAENIAAINKISGIGKKTTERIILELKDKLIKKYGPISQSAKASDKNRSLTKISYSDKEDIVSAFLGLGYQRKQLEELIIEYEKELSTHQKVEESIRFLLTKL